MPARRADRHFDDSILRFLPAPLREARRPFLAILVGWATAFFPSLALSALVHQFAPDLQQPDFPVSGATAFALLVLFAPLVETLIMAGVLSILARFLPAHLAVLASAIGWGAAHSSMAPAWGLVIWWPFLVFSALYMVWREKGFWAGVAVAAATHAMQNLGPGLILALGLA